MASRLSVILTLASFFAFVLSASTATTDECVYTLYVQTGSMIKSGTDSNISVSLSDSKGKSVQVQNLKDWGLMGYKHDYFERGNLDIFAGRGPCIGTPICKLNVTSDGSGAHHGWLCDSIEVTTTGPHRGCSQSLFYVDQWLGLDVSPHQLSAVLDACGMVARSTNGPYVVHRPIGSFST